MAVALSKKYFQKSSFGVSSFIDYVALEFGPGSNKSDILL